MVFVTTKKSEEDYSIMYKFLSQIIVGILIFELIYMFGSKMDIFHFSFRK